MFFRRIFPSARSTTWCCVCGVSVWNPLKLVDDIFVGFCFYKRSGDGHFQKIFSMLPNQGTMRPFGGSKCGVNSRKFNFFNLVSGTELLVIRVLTMVPSWILSFFPSSACRLNIYEDEIERRCDISM